MKRDKSEKERFELNRKIQRLESQEDDFKALSRAYEHSLMQFQSDFQRLTHQMDYLLQESRQDRQSTNDMEANRSLHQQVNRYVEMQKEQVTALGRQVRASLEKDRERLITERNHLPWE